MRGNRFWQPQFCRAARTGRGRLGTALDAWPRDGGGGIRTPGGLAPTTAFKAAAFNRSATPPYSVRIAWRHEPRRTIAQPSPGGLWLVCKTIAERGGTMIPAPRGKSHT